MCSYCGEAPATSDHIQWGCKHFDPIRKDVDVELASIAHKHLPESIRKGIAPAMKLDGQRTYWGTEISQDLSAKAKRLLGQDTELTTDGINARITEQREAAAEICNDQQNEGCNARQVMLK